MKYGTSTAGAFNYHYFKEVGSTNDTLAELARQNAPEWTVVLADHQTNGRGRYRRSWHSPAGLGMWLSLLLRPAFDNRQLNFINLLAANTMATVLEQLATTVQQQMVTGLKWPNDVLIKNKKVSGILLESNSTGSKLDSLVIGIGINANQHKFEGEYKIQPTSLKFEVKREISRERLMSEVLNNFEEILYGMKSNTKKMLDDWRDKCRMIGEHISIEVNGELKGGIFYDIDANGFMILKDGDKLEKITKIKIIY